MHFLGTMKSWESLIEEVRTIVVKVGSRVLCDEDHSLNTTRIAHLVKEISALHDHGYSVVLVTSGAIGVGMGVLGYPNRPTELAEKQACAAIGQIRLMQRYADLFESHSKITAQILLSGEDFRDKRRFHNIRNTMSTLLGKGIIPIVNENDTVATEEIKVGDNDKLSADVAQFLEADLLILLSDEEGLYDKNPKSHANAKLFHVVERVSKEILQMGENRPGSKVSVGGMRSKLNAIKQVTESGTPVILTRGVQVRLLAWVQGRGAGTLFLPKAIPVGRKRRWLAFVSKAKGQILLDSGAIRALQSRPSSVLAAGIRKVDGSFSQGDIVELCNLEGEALGRGRTAYSSSEISLILGQKSHRIQEILGRKGPGVVVHRDHLVVY